MIKRPTLAFISVGICIVLVGAVIAYVANVLWAAFLAAPLFNILIAAALAAGIASIVWRLLLIDRAARWIASIRKPPFDGEMPPPSIIAPVALLLGSVKDGNSSGSTVDSVLDGVIARTDEKREFSRYFANVVILLGLLGTFWGLFHTVSGVGAVVGGLTIGDGDLPQVFQQLKSGLDRPLAGMATSFSASLFGLASAIILGFFETIVVSTQNKFLNNLEDWLREKCLEPVTPLAIPAGRSADPAQLRAIVDSISASVSRLCEQIQARDEIAAGERKALRDLVALIAGLGERIEIDDQLLRKFGESQLNLKPAVDQLIETLNGQLAKVQERWVTQLARIEALLQQLAEESAVGRQQIGTQLRQEMPHCSRR